eukprot:154858-Chlamydomonas_euryale.AAC.4
MTTRVNHVGNATGQLNRNHLGKRTDISVDCNKCEANLGSCNGCMEDSWLQWASPASWPRPSSVAGLTGSPLGESSVHPVHTPLKHGGQVSREHREAVHGALTRLRNSPTNHLVGESSCVLLIQLSSPLGKGAGRRLYLSVGVCGSRDAAMIWNVFRCALTC